MELLPQEDSPRRILPSAVDCAAQPKQKPQYLPESPRMDGEDDLALYRKMRRVHGSEMVDQKWGELRAKLGQRNTRINHWLRIQQMCLEAAREARREFGDCDVCPGSGIVSSLSTPRELRKRLIGYAGEAGNVEVATCLCVEKYLPAPQPPSESVDIGQWFSE